MKGAFNQRPPQSKYSMTWNLSVVTRHVTSIGESHSLSLKLLSFKLVMLLASTRPSRSHDLSNLDLKYMKSLPDGVEFKSSSLTKQSRLSKPTAPFTLPAILVDKNLCPKETLSEYISRTESYVQKGRLGSFSLTLNHTSLSSSVARWVLTMLGSAGIDTDSFKAHLV